MKEPAQENRSCDNPALGPSLVTRVLYSNMSSTSSPSPCNELDAPLLLVDFDLNIEKVLSQMSIDEKAALTRGAFPPAFCESFQIELIQSIGVDMWHTTAIPRLKVPSLRLSDGPNGVRGTKFFDSTPGACLPCGTGLGATWDIDLMRQLGNLLGIEAKAKGVTYS
jgi:beta-glucosidase-like glycosyl hydrolase